MADRLTQLQDCLDDLLTQMYATLSYIQGKHPYGDIDGQPSQGPKGTFQSAPRSAAPHAAAPAHINGDTNSTDVVATGEKETERHPQTLSPEEGHVFVANMRELARDLILKEQQIEYLIQSLPGIGTSETEQTARMMDLASQLTEVEAERERAETSRSEVGEAVTAVLMGIKTVPA